MALKFNELLEGANLSNEAKASLQEAWNAKLSEAREEITSELREEFAQRYEHDKGLIVEAMDNFVSQTVAKEMAEFAEDRKSLTTQEVKYRKAVTEHAKMLDRFVTKMVAKEVRELRDDRTRVAEHVSKLDKFVGTQLAEELKEFHADKQALVEQKVKMVAEGKKQLAEAKRNFVTKAAKSVESTINRVISEEVKSFRNDITSARENDFGRRIFEAFATEYNSSYLNEGKEIKKIQKQMAALGKQLREAKSQIVQRDEQVKLTESKLRIATDKYNRKETLNKLMAPLGKEKRAIMSDLLESVKTDKLEAAFNKYLPSVLDGNPQPARRALKESASKAPTGRTITGNKKQATVAGASEATNDNDVVEINALRKLAGLS